MKNSSKLKSSGSIGLEVLIQISRRVNRLILDYALGAAILGVLPLYGQSIPAIRLTLLLLLNLKMLWDIRIMWGSPQRRKVLNILGLLVAIVRSWGLGVVVWILVLALGLVFPGIDSIARAIAYGVITWSMGLAITRYFSNPLRLDLKALHRAQKITKLSD